MAMSWWADLEVWRNRHRELLREAQERQLAREARRIREAFAPLEKRPGAVVVRWGLSEDEAWIAELLELNGMPRWVAFEERFIVAEREGEVLAALRYRTEPERIVLGLLVVDPWGGEPDLAVALYAGAGELAREMGASEVLAPVGRAEYLAEAGYRRRGRGWRLDATRPVEVCGKIPARGWRRIVALLGVVATPFFRTSLR